MLIIRDKSHLPEHCYGAVIALGNFDGVHLGHRAVIGKTLEVARKMGKPAAVMTFEPHPRRIFKPDLPTLRIFPFAEKARLLKELGLDYLRVIRFTKAFSKTTAPQFIDDVLLGRLKISHVVTGDDFIFGHNREGNAQFMQEMAIKRGFSYTVCEKVMVEKERSSSTRIRHLLAEGAVDEAAKLLGRPYCMMGIVRSGEKRGRQLGFPTANILPGRIFMPAYGIYAIQAKIRGQTVAGAASLGINPTFGLSRPMLEVYLFDWQEDIYGEHMEVDFIKYIRPEKKFDDIEALKRQIHQDCSDTKNILNL